MAGEAKAKAKMAAIMKSRNLSVKAKSTGERKYNVNMAKMKSAKMAMAAIETSKAKASNK
jgi:hypothetical protein